MTYIVQRKDRFYVVAYDGLDPLTGKERRRLHPVGNNRIEAEGVAAQLDAAHTSGPPPRGGPIEFGAFLTETWLPQKRRQVRATTAYRYAWFIQHYVNPAIGHVPLRRLRADHLDTLYECLATTGGKDSTGLAHKTVHEVHMIIRAALELAVLRGLLDRNVAHATIARRRRVTKSAARIWTPHEVGHFLHVATTQRLYPALHLTAHTGMRRGEIVGLKWGDLDNERKRLSISRTLQTVGGVPTEVGVKTRTGRRCVDLDTETLNILNRWQQRLHCDDLPHRDDDRMFCNTTGRHLNPESISQLFERIVRNSELPRIRFHDLRHTHASILLASGTPIKVVTERLGHAHPAFTIATYQHLLPGMGADAADQFAALVVPGAGRRLPAPSADPDP